MMLNRIVLVVSLVALAGCSTPVQSYCAAQDECGGNGDQSEEQCSADRQAKIDAAREDPDCITLADSYEKMLSCEGALSCEQLSLSTSDSPCRAEIEAFTGALVHNPMCIFS